MTNYPQMVRALEKQIKDLKLVAETAHFNAQWAMDANRRQVLRIKRILAYLDEIEQAEKQNWETGAAMATNAESRDELMARAKGRLDMIARLRELIFPSPVSTEVTKK